MDLQPGKPASKNFILDKKIESLDELLKVLNSSPSVFWRNKIQPSAFVRSLQFHYIAILISAGVLWTIKNNNPN